MVDKKIQILLQFWLPVFLWTGFIFILSSVPGKDIPEIPIPYFHKIVHFAEFSFLGALFIRALIHSNLNLSVTKLTLLSLSIISLFALSDEWHQRFIPGRSGELGDAIYDTAYSFIGIYLYIVTNKMLLKMKIKGNGSYPN